MTSPYTPDTDAFRTDFVEQITDFFGESFDNLQQRERAHAIGVVANTLAALAVNQANGVDTEGMTATLGTLSDTANQTIETLVTDEAASLLFPQSRRICDVIRSVIAERQT